MRISCPACEATYEVPDRLIGTGRTLRCKACRHAWHVGPATPAAAPEPAPAPPAPPPAQRTDLPPPVATRPRPPQPIEPPLPRTESPPPRAGAALAAAWIGSILAVAGMVAALWVFRAEVVAAWPPAARLFALLDQAPAP
ncbi:zinc-ribbon domain-containing protein [Paracraurococcus lichenis]|uniref:Zinc-ribbon domain-containing protein n=1 Tax=Paracraurococcus lichenis TaxID=3064888 RepID=A0ABT9DYF3_9PROT|nr:zinc-ribbon domain-containing protein [Paracraurococcus sp. LOR1-02]MDO9708940.1 zinc-ribbon domain-containing protein [Paracraurococcus sp. LOR1-02]